MGQIVFAGKYSAGVAAPGASSERALWIGFLLEPIHQRSGHPRRPQGTVESRRDPVSHQCPKTRSDALDEATQMRHAKRPDHYLCDTVEQLFTHLSSLGAKWSPV
jgi:hypothetical protein